jgi:hypothetical protein
LPDLGVHKQRKRLIVRRFRLNDPAEELLEAASRGGRRGTGAGRVDDYSGRQRFSGVKLDAIRRQRLYGSAKAKVDAGGAEATLRFGREGSGFDGGVGAREPAAKTGENDLVVGPTMIDEGFEKFASAGVEIGGMERPRVFAAERSAPFEQGQLQRRLLFREREGEQNAVESAPDDDHVEG